MTRNILIALLRADLRLHDHPIFSACTPSSDKLKNVTHVLPIYVFDQKYMEVGGITGMQKGDGPGGKQGAKTRVAGFWRCGVHRVRFLHKSVYNLQSNLRRVGSDLSLWAGQPHVILPKIIKALQEKGDHVEAVWMSKEPHTEEVNTEERIRECLGSTQTPLKLLHTRTLIDPRDLPFPIKNLPDIYTSFRKQVEAPDMYREPVPAPDKLKEFATLPDIENSKGALKIDMSEGDLLKGLLKPLEDEPGPLPISAKEIEQNELSAFPYSGGETEALERLEHYFKGGKQSPAFHYKETRNGMLGADYSTKFNAALAHGLISPRLIAQRADKMEKETGTNRGGGYWIIFELLWRDYFSYVSQKYGSSLYTIEGIEGDLDSKVAQKKKQDWLSPSSFEDKKDAFVRWATYQTGVPLIDANMKELALTGFMSNRGRQNVASLLTKDLYYDWRLGAEWFEAQLIDYDPASNYGNWQYVAGVGNDPRSSRQFNPIKQAKDYDKEAKYVKAWLPVLEPIDAGLAHHPWTGPNGSPEGYPSSPVIENPSWKSHYHNGPRRGGIRGGGGGRGRGGGGRGGGGRGGGGGGGGGGGRGRGGGGNNNRRGRE